MLNPLQTSDEVYLIFSVNKSGHFFGYARMASEIRVNSETLASQPRLVGTNVTVTPKTSSAPRGVIFADRGTSFWEVAESSEEDESLEHKEEGGNVFRIEWIRWENPIPFHQIREIRNPWNRNQEVKVSRDGTEIEPSVGAILLAAFDAKPDCLPQASRSNVSGSPTRHSPMRLPPPTQFQSNATNAIVYPHTTMGSPDQGLAYSQYSGIQPQPMQYNYGRIIY